MHTPFSKRITNLVHLGYQVCFTSKLSLSMIQEPWAFLSREENKRLSELVGTLGIAFGILAACQVFRVP